MKTIRSFTLMTYKNNRVAIKLMECLKKGNVYDVKKIRQKREVTPLYRITIESNVSEEMQLKLLCNEMESYIADNFTPNYMFSINNLPFGFINSFEVRSIEHGSDLKFSWGHRIKEIKDGSIMPKNQII